MTYTAADVPSRVDVLIAGEGYRFLETDEVKGISSFAPTFLQRTNVSDAYGDEDQDWWLTMSQKDWSLGEGQRFFSLEVEESRRRYWLGSSVDVSKDGQVSIAASMTSVTAAASVVAAASGQSGRVYYATSTNVYYVDASGSVTDLSTHGLGSTPPTYQSLLVDGTGNVFVSSASKIRRLTGAWGDFDASNGAHYIIEFNNAIYGLNDAATLYRWSTGGTRSTIYTWQGGLGSVVSGSSAGSCRALAIYGGDLAILIRGGVDSSQQGGIWIYDGVAPAMVSQHPAGFVESDICAVGGALFVGGTQLRARGATLNFRPTVFVYANGNLTKLWESDSTMTTSSVTALCPHEDGVLWTDNAAGSLMFYNPNTGAVTTVASITTDSSITGRALQGCSQASFYCPNGSTAGKMFPGSATASSGFVCTSLFDGSTTRTKRFKSVVVEFDAASDGDGGTVDISYRLNDVDGSYTSVQTGAVSGTEYAIGQNGRAISIKVTLNKGTSTYGPRLKRIYVRAAPLLDTFRKERYVLDLTGVDGDQHIQMRDGITVHPKDGLAMATDLRTAIASTTPVTIVDEFGSYSAYLVPEECEIRRVRSQEYTAVITARQV